MTPIDNLTWMMKVDIKIQSENLKKKAKQSKRYQFIAEHRGGSLTKENHRKLIRWARECSEHVLSLIDKEIDKRLLYALDVAKERAWQIKKLNELPTDIVEIVQTMWIKKELDKRI